VGRYRTIIMRVVELNSEKVYVCGPPYAAVPKANKEAVGLAF